MGLLLVLAIFTLAEQTIAKPGNCMRIMDWYVFNMLNLINGYFHLYYPNYFIVSNRHLAGGLAFLNRIRPIAEEWVIRFWWKCSYGFFDKPCWRFDILFCKIWSSYKNLGFIIFGHFHTSGTDRETIGKPGNWIRIMDWYVSNMFSLINR